MSDVKYRSKRKFWMVWNPLNGNPSKQHLTSIDAEAEACRLAKINRDTEFYVLAVESSVHVPSEVMPIATKYYGNNEAGDE